MVTNGYSLVTKMAPLASMVTIPKMVTVLPLMTMIIHWRYYPLVIEFNTVTKFLSNEII
jgi:hypothetical protein